MKRVVRCAGLLLAGACAAQTPKFLLPAGNIAAGRDLSGDGVPDFVVGQPDALGGAGQVTVHSGVDGALLASLSGAPGAQFGKLLAVVGDTDGDGVADLVVSGATTSITIILGAAFTATTVPSPFVPTLLADVGDVDNDGRGDYALGVAGINGAWTINIGCQCSQGPSTQGVLAVVSGATTSLLSTVLGAPGNPWPTSVVGVGDVTGDGLGEVAVAGVGRAISNYTCYPWCTSPAVNATIKVYNGVTGALVAQRSFSPVTSIVLAAPGDVDMDGVPDLACRLTASMTPVFGRSILMWRGSDLFELWTNFMLYSGSGAIAAPGQMDDVFAGDVLFSDTIDPLPRVRCLSGFGGAERWTIYGPAAYPATASGFGRQVVAAGDLDGDGRGDFVVGSLAASYVYLGATLGVEPRVPGCSASGAPPTLNAVPTVPGMPSVLRGGGAPPYPNGGTVLASFPGPSSLTLPPGVLGAAACVVDLDPAFFFPLGATISEAQNAAGVRGTVGLAPPPGYPTTDWVVPDHWYFPIQVPNDPAWAGFALRLQAAFFPAVGTPTLTNSVQLTIVAP